VGLEPSPRINLSALDDEDGPFINVEGIYFAPNGVVTLDYVLSYATAGTDTTGQRTFDLRADGSGTFVARIDVQGNPLSSATVTALDRSSNRKDTKTLER
jgi:hypothetical protein